MHKIFINLNFNFFIFFLFLLSVLLQSCQTAPPIFFYNRSYVAPNSNLDTDKKATIGVVMPTKGKNLTSMNNSRYLYGSFISELEDLSYTKMKNEEKKNTKKFNIKLFNSIEDVFKNKLDYAAIINTLEYGTNSFRVGSKSGDEVEFSEGTTECFKLEVSIYNRKRNQVYLFRSNGCPGVSDPRVIASNLFEYMFDKMWAIDSTRAHKIVIHGNAGTWFSDFITNKKVDKFYKITKSTL